MIVKPTCYLLPATCYMLHATKHSLPEVGRLILATIGLLWGNLCSRCSRFPYLLLYFYRAGFLLPIFCYMTINRQTCYTCYSTPMNCGYTGGAI